MQNYLNSSQYFDFLNADVQAYADSIIDTDKLSEAQIAIRLYNAVRDDILYNPYVFSFEPRTFSASYCLSTKESYCIPKAVLLGAMARYKGIPARIGLANVRNHLSSQKLLNYLQSDIFVMHGYIELYIEGHWVKATPAFNLALCNKMGVKPLIFNAKEDSVFQAFNHKGVKQMEYISDHGTFDEVPIEFIQESVMAAYPHLIQAVKQKTHIDQSMDDEI